MLKGKDRSGRWNTCSTATLYTTNPT